MAAMAAAAAADAAGSGGGGAAAATVAVWYDTEANGCNTASASCIEKILAGQFQEVHRVSCAEIREGALRSLDVDVLCVGGGELAIIDAMGEEGLREIRDCVCGERRMGYVGFCLGSLISGQGYLEIFPHEGRNEGDMRVFGGCAEGSFHEQPPFGHPDNATWMVCGKASVVWPDTERLGDGWPHRPPAITCSHPPIIRPLPQAMEGGAVSVLARYGPGCVESVEMLPMGAKCPMTESVFRRGVEERMVGQVALATGPKIAVTGLHPEMCSDDTNHGLVLSMVKHAAAEASGIAEQPSST